MASRSFTMAKEIKEISEIALMPGWEQKAAQFHYEDCCPYPQFSENMATLFNRIHGALFHRGLIATHSPMRDPLGHEGRLQLWKKLFTQHPNTKLILHVHNNIQARARGFEDRVSSMAEIFRRILLSDKTVPSKPDDFLDRMTRFFQILDAAKRSIVEIIHAQKDLVDDKIWEVKLKAIELLGPTLVFQIRVKGSSVLIASIIKEGRYTADVAQAIDHAILKIPYEGFEIKERLDILMLEARDALRNIRVVDKRGQDMNAVARSLIKDLCEVVPEIFTVV